MLVDRSYSCRLMDLDRQQASSRLYWSRDVEGSCQGLENHRAGANINFIQYLDAIAACAKTTIGVFVAFSVHAAPKHEVSNSQGNTAGSAYRNTSSPVPTRRISKNRSTWCGGSQNIGKPDAEPLCFQNNWSNSSIVNSSRGSVLKGISPSS